jgi:hypothetical protein
MMLLANVSPQQINPIEETLSDNVHLHVAMSLKEIGQEFADGRSHKLPAFIVGHITLQLKVCKHTVATKIEHRPSVLTKRDSFSVADYATNARPWNVTSRIQQGADVCSAQVTVSNLESSTINTHKS